MDNLFPKAPAELPTDNNLSLGMDETLNDPAADKTSPSTPPISPIQLPSNPADNPYKQDFLLDNDTSPPGSPTSTETSNIDSASASTLLSPPLHVHTPQTIVWQREPSILSQAPDLNQLPCNTPTGHTPSTASNFPTSKVATTATTAPWYQILPHPPTTAKP